MGRFVGIFIEFPREQLMFDHGEIHYYLVDRDGDYHQRLSVTCQADSDFDAISLMLRRRVLTDLRRSMM